MSAADGAEGARTDAEVDETVVVLLADGQHDLVIVAIRAEMPDVDPVLAILGALARELVRASELREVDTMGVKALGAMVGGLFGIETTAEDELILDLHAAGARLLGRLRQLESSVRCAAGAFGAVDPQP